MRVRHSRLLAAVLLSIAFCGALSQENRRWVILPESEVKSIRSFCSRSAPSDIEGSWTPTTKDIEALESHLSNLSKPDSAQKRFSIEHPERFYRQYLGILIKGRKLIYLNAFSGPYLPKSWLAKMVIVCDGGVDSWGVVYDLGIEEFSDLHVNGFA
jgi:hypothetical protein